MCRFKASAGRLRPWGGLRKLLDKLRRNITRSYAVSTSATYLVFGCTIWFLWMSQVVIKGLGFDELAGPLSGLRRFRFPSSIVIDAIRYFLRILRTGSSYDGFSEGLRMPMFSKILSNNFLSTATDGQRQSLFSSWITLPSTGRRISSGCPRMQALSWYICHHIHRI